VEEVIVDMVEITRELEIKLEPEKVTEFLQSHNKMLTMSYSVLD
jgi:hypothetical protein